MAKMDKLFNQSNYIIIQNKNENSLIKKIQEQKEASKINIEQKKELQLIEKNMDFFQNEIKDNIQYLRNENSLLKEKLELEQKEKIELIMENEMLKNKIKEYKAIIKKIRNYCDGK